MKINARIFWLITGIFIISTGMISCNKPDVVNYSKEGNIYIPRAAGDQSKFGLLLADTPQVISFAAAYGGLKYPSQDITVTFKTDPSLVDAYNLQNNSSYVLLPAESYNIPGLTAVIKAGQTISDVLPLNVTTTNLDKALKYMLPISITNVSSGFIDSSLHTVYFRIDTIQRLEKDITNLAVLSVSKDNDGGPDAGEGSKKLVDGDYNSKFLTGGFPQDFWVQLTFPAAQILGAYTITSGNDAPERDMKDWTLEGSNDGTTWTVLDTRTDETFSDRNVTNRYEFANTEAYKQYRINLIANNGSDLVQVSEWRVITYP